MNFRSDHNDVIKKTESSTSSDHNNYRVTFIIITIMIVIIIVIVAVEKIEIKKLLQEPSSRRFFKSVSPVLQVKY